MEMKTLPFVIDAAVWACASFFEAEPAVSTN